MGFGSIKRRRGVSRKFYRKHAETGGRTRILDVRTVIHRGDYGEKAYEADACVMGPAIRKRGGAKRCQYGSGRTPTAAVKAALGKLARSLK